MQKSFNINSTAVVKLTNRLEKINRVAMPIAVRSTLNDAAFDLRQKELPQSYNDNFTVRKPSFIKAGTTLQKVSKTYKINEMQSAVGLNTKGAKLAEQEEGATVSNRDYIPLQGARVGNDRNKLVSKKFYLKNILPNLRGNTKNIFTGKNAQPLIRAAFKAGVGGALIYNDVLFQVRITKNKPKLFIKLVSVYSYKENRIYKLKPREFMKNASAKSYFKVEDFYTKNANYQFNRLKK